MWISLFLLVTNSFINNDRLRRAFYGTIFQKLLAFGKPKTNQFYDMTKLTANKLLSIWTTVTVTC